LLLPQAESPQETLQFRVLHVIPKMRRFLPILVLVCLAWLTVVAAAQNPPTTSPQSTVPPAAKSGDQQALADDKKARAIVQQAIQALGGQQYINMRSRETKGRGFSFHHGRPSGTGVIFWNFLEFSDKGAPDKGAPDKERTEYTPERDIARVYVGNKAWEITYKGPKLLDQKDLDDYLRLRHFSLDTILRTWINDPGVILLYQGNAIAAQHEAYKITLINAKDEAVDLFFDTESHLPVKKSFEWRDPVDRQKNLEEEIYENYRDAGGVQVAYVTTRYFNGDMAAERFLNGATLNENLDESMFDPNSGYNPNKPAKKK
jgi:hypothetical protein